MKEYRIISLDWLWTMAWLFGFLQFMVWGFYSVIHLRYGYRMEEDDEMMLMGVTILLELIAMVVTIVLIVREVLQDGRRTFMLTPDAVVFSQGITKRSHRSIPYSEVVNAYARPSAFFLWRLLGLHVVYVDTFENRAFRRVECGEVEEAETRDDVDTWLIKRAYIPKKRAEELVTILRSRQDPALIAFLST